MSATTTASRTCQHCAHWGRERAGVCDAPQSDLDRVRTAEGSAFTLRQPDGFNVWATAADDHNLEAALVTGPAFGCLRFLRACPVCKGARHTLDARGYYAGPCTACNGTGGQPDPAPAPLILPPAVADALAFYADAAKWRDQETGIGTFPGEAIDYGHRAREALASLSPTPSPATLNA